MCMLKVSKEHYFNIVPLFDNTMSFPLYGDFKCRMMVIWFIRCCILLCTISCLVSSQRVNNIRLIFIWLQDGNEVFFKIKRKTKLKKMMNAYCDQTSVDLKSIVFLFEGRKIRAEQTPDEVCLSTWILLTLEKYVTK